MTPQTALPPSPLPIVGHGHGWLVVEKPVTMSVHNEPGADLCAVLTAWLKSHPEAAASMALDTDFGLHPPHRLDKETSGVILLSCRRQVFDHFAREFAQGKVFKQYLAVAHGAVAIHADWQWWQWPLTKKAAGRRNPQGSGRRSPSRTAYRCIRQTRHYSLIECRLDTGRTHQIRRHAVLAGHPLVGDRRYGSLRACRFLEEKLGFNRLGLHADKLGIRLPHRKKLQHFKTKGLPTALQQLLNRDE